MAAASLALAAVCVCGHARAGAWPLEPGETLAILKYERAEADDAWDLDGRRYDWVERSDETASLHLEHGLTRRITLQGKLAWSRGEEAGVAYEGRGPTELGLRYALFRDERMAISLYVGGIAPGDGRNAGYAPPGAGEAAGEARLLAGRSFAAAEGVLFVEAQAARIGRAGLPDETRLDLTVGYARGARWLLLGQTYAGWTDAEPSWVKVEVSAVRHFGDWSLQAGWRGSVAGKAGPVEDGPVLALWRRF
ncbi:MAG: hypothetical protein Q7J28_14555 [Caulobacter sp.]|nr:hypothetical protein [Caulobacter sp.]